ncbi:MAG: hypothetical protein ACI8QG_003042, partial [Flavobacteriales bacterium]
QTLFIQADRRQMIKEMAYPTSSIPHQNHQYFIKAITRYRERNSSEAQDNSQHLIRA